jgi:hypothetical protein
MTNIDIAAMNNIGPPYSDGMTEAELAEPLPRRFRTAVINSLAPEFWESIRVMKNGPGRLKTWGDFFAVVDLQIKWTCVVLDMATGAKPGTNAADIRRYRVAKRRREFIVIGGEPS